MSIKKLLVIAVSFFCLMPLVAQNDDSFSDFDIVALIGQGNTANIYLANYSDEIF